MNRLRTLLLVEFLSSNLAIREGENDSFQYWFKRDRWLGQTRTAFPFLHVPPPWESLWECSLAHYFLWLLSEANSRPEPSQLAVSSHRALSSASFSLSYFLLSPPDFPPRRTSLLCLFPWGISYWVYKTETSRFLGHCYWMKIETHSSPLLRRPAQHPDACGFSEPTEQKKGFGQAGRLRLAFKITKV